MRQFGHVMLAFSLCCLSDCSRPAYTKDLQQILVVDTVTDSMRLKDSFIVAQCRDTAGSGQPLRS